MKIRKAVLKFLIDHYVHKNNLTLGLFVGIENQSAKKLYLKIGFKSSGNKILVGKHMEHLQCSVK